MAMQGRSTNTNVMPDPAISTPAQSIPTSQ
jgi:hypothetical protein